MHRAFRDHDCQPAAGANLLALRRARSAMVRTLGDIAAMLVLATIVCGALLIAPVAAQQPLTAAAEAGLTSGDRFKECTDCPAMVVIPAGRFVMGSVKGEGDSDEQGPGGKPIAVTIAVPYALGQYVATVSDYMACVDAKGCPPPAWREPDTAYHAIDADHFKKLGDALTNPAYPIVGATWFDAQAYVVWLNRKLGLSAEHAYRLPSEAEWEAAARGGREGLKYSWGNDFTANSANGSGSSGADKWEFTSPVGSFPPNPYGLYDMHGNVWQWVEDCYHLSYADMPAAITTTGGPWTATCDASGRRVLRGGSWIDDPRVLRSADRGGSAPDTRYSYVGFRVARSLGR